MAFGKKFGLGGAGGETPTLTPHVAQAPVAEPAAQDASTASAPPPLPAQAAQPSQGVQSVAHAAASVSEDTPMIRYRDPRLETAEYVSARWQLVEIMLEKMDFKQIETIHAARKKDLISNTAKQLMHEVQIPLNGAQQELLAQQMPDEILGFGPLEPLMRDVDVSDIMINTHKTVYIEKHGKLARCDIDFASEGHLLNVIQRIVSLVGRRVDEASPMVDARMPDGSRFNAIIPPLAIDGSLVSIRKFKKNKMPLRDYVKYGSMTEEMAAFLEICGAIRLNTLVSGGTGSGKTTLLNALSGCISLEERVITIEDAAELQMHQPHVLRLETRPANAEGVGEVNQRQLVKNALRMRPDRIILGEIRGGEVIDVLAAMNTGHEGSMATIHANNPRDCLSRIENLVGMAGISLPTVALRGQVASAINLIVQLSRMRDGTRRITHIEEIVGMETDVITTQKIFGYKPGPMDASGKLTGYYYYTGIKPRFFEQAIHYNLSDKLEGILRAAEERQRSEQTRRH